MAKQEKSNLLEKSEQLVFINECLPQLVAGRYTVTADLAIDSNMQLKKAKKDFWVDAPRFILQQSDIYSIYPPRNATGRFETTLPHIVFNRRTLPWERTIDGQTADNTRFRDTQGRAPWMGLLLLNEDEINSVAVPLNRISAENKSLKDIFINKPANVYVPQISNLGGSKPALSAWEDVNSTCEVIDVPLELFKTIMPQKDDLLFLGHVRKVLVDDNKEKADIEDGEYFSTLVCNRLPTRSADVAQSKRNTVFLVSLEGFHNYFLNPGSITEGKVRLIVLTSWSFTVAKGKNFLELCQDMKVNPLKMNATTPDNQLAGAYDYGYSLLPHVTRNGAKTFSWYRGPFNPNFLPANPETKIFECADEALRFDRNSGLFDISYAAAWQLGRLLALKDKVFSTALYQWKMQEKRNVLKKAANKEVHALLPHYRASEGTDTGSLEESVKDFLKQKYRAGSEKHMSVSQLSADPHSTREQLNDITDSGDTGNKVPAEVTDWLGKLFLLHGVPLNYMIPHENYLVSREKNNLVKEALGTFYIDYAWVEALLGGALSIVSARDSESLLKMLKDGRFLPENLVENREVVKDLIPDDEGDFVPKPVNIPGHITGFLLRSELVSGWKGIKIFPRDVNHKWMDAPLRIEKIAEDIKLCIFSGKVQEIVFIQPPEGIHFGIEGGSNAKKLRDPNGVVGDKSVPLVVRNGGVINIAGTAAAMKQVKKRSDGKDDAYSSADFAFQMLEGPVMFVLRIKD